MKKRTQKSQKRTKFLFILIVLTAILSITATYAWFSTQRDVEIGNLKINVESAENLQISLDGVNWSQTITINDMKQLYGVSTETGVYQASTTKNANYIPTELLPISTDGQLGKGSLDNNDDPTGDQEKGILKFVKGNVDGVKLEDIVPCDESDITKETVNATVIGNRETKNENHPYLVFDIYLRNLSRRSGDTYTTEDADASTEDAITTEMIGTYKEGAADKLLLAAGSKVWVDTANKASGLQNSARVAFVAASNPENGADITASQDTILSLAADGSEKVSIWEPNYKNHSDYVVKNHPRAAAGTKITETSENVTYPVKTTTTWYTDTDLSDNGGVDESKAITSVTTVPNVNAVADTSDSEYVADPSNLDTTNLSKITVVRADYDDNGTKVVSGTNEGYELTTVDGSGTLLLAPNKINKVRVYVWLEGQDPDCIDMASVGDYLFATIRLEKPANTDASGGDTYVPDAE